MGMIRPPETLQEWAAWLDRAPAGTMLSADVLRAAVRAALAGADATPAPVQAAPAWSWREKLWDVPSETRMGVLEVAEALGRPRSWVYRHTGEKSGKARLPCRRLDGELLFCAGEVRAWIRDHEETLAGGRMDGPERPRLLRAS